MNSIEFLKGIGLAEVSRKTHIDADYLSHIVNKDYEKLTRLNTKGFIKILQREYDIDFEEWLNGYESFLKEHEAEKHESRITVEPSVSSYKSVSKSSYGFLWTVILLAILAIGAWFFELYKYFDEFPNLFRDENQSVSYSNTTTVQAARQNLIILKEENGSLLLPPPEENTSIEPIRDVPALSAEDNATDQRQISSEEQNSTSPNEEFDLSGLKEIQIIPAKKVWIGIVDLSADKKRSLNTDSSVSIETAKKQLVVVGHGEITLKIGTNIKKFSSDNPIRFLLRNGKLKTIDLDEFTVLNKGKTW